MTTRHALQLPAAVVVALMLLVGSVDDSAAKTYTVEVNTDLPDAKLDDGQCSTVEPPNVDLDTCTLRAAIENANRDVDKDTVAFGLPPGMSTIVLDSYLPDLSEAVDIDGWTQSGAVPGNTMIPRPAVRIRRSQWPPAS